MQDILKAALTGLFYAGILILYLTVLAGSLALQGFCLAIGFRALLQWWPLG